MRAYQTHDEGDPAHYDAQRSGHLEDRRLEVVAEAVRATGSSTVIELGGGSGRISWRLATSFPETAFSVVEPYTPLVEFGTAKYPAANLVRLTSIPAAARADLIFSIDVIHHLENRPKVFADLARASAPGAGWIAIEPNIWHPAILYSQERMRRQGADEDHFRPWRSEPEFRSTGWEISTKGYMHLWPGSVKSPAPWMRCLERRLERLPLAGASVVYKLRRR